LLKSTWRGTRRSVHREARKGEDEVVVEEEAGAAAAVMVAAAVVVVTEEEVVGATHANEGRRPSPLALLLRNAPLVLAL
jgi:hypothetical protein